jgi:hypothetical protein
MEMLLDWNNSGYGLRKGVNAVTNFDLRSYITWLKPSAPVVAFNPRASSGDASNPGRAAPPNRDPEAIRSS